MNSRSTLLLEHHLKELKLPSFLREYGKMAAQSAAEGLDHRQYLLRLAELELIDRHQRMVERRTRAARFPAVKTLDSFDFTVVPSVNKALVMELARCEYVQHRENVIAVGNSGTGKTHMALGLGLAACQRGMSVGFTTAAALVHEMMEARDERRLLNLQRQLSRLNLLIIDELGFVPLSPTGAELLFEVFSQRYERGSILVTTNLPFDEWTEVFGSERLTGALLDRLTHHVHILEMNGESYRLKRSREGVASQTRDLPHEEQVVSRPSCLSSAAPPVSRAFPSTIGADIFAGLTHQVVQFYSAPVAQHASAIDTKGLGLDCARNMGVADMSTTYRNIPTSRICWIPSNHCVFWGSALFLSGSPRWQWWPSSLMTRMGPCWDFPSAILSITSLGVSFLASISSGVVGLAPPSMSCCWRVLVGSESFGGIWW